MNRFVIWSLSLLGAALIISLIEGLLPPASHRGLSLVLRLFLLVSVLSPLPQFWNAPRPAFSDFSTTVVPFSTDAQLEREISTRIDRLLREKLGEMGIIPTAIDIPITIAGRSPRFGTLRVMLGTADGESANQIASTLSGYLGLSVTVETEEPQ